MHADGGWKLWLDFRSQKPRAAIKMSSVEALNLGWSMSCLTFEHKSANGSSQDIEKLQMRYDKDSKKCKK